jgi:hypothetical protein
MTSTAGKSLFERLGATMPSRRICQLAMRPEYHSDRGATE